MNENMRGLFFIVKGQYTKGAEPSFLNEATGSVNYIGGYDPESEDTNEWYMLVDRKTFTCVRSGSVFSKVLEGVYKSIKRHKGDVNRYLKSLGTISNTAPSTRCIYKEVYDSFGDYFSEEIREMEDLAYQELRESTPFHKSRKLVKKVKTPNTLMEETPKKEKVLNTTPKRLVKNRVKIGVKKLTMEQ